MSRTLKQQWSFERLFSHKGSLNGIATRLFQIASADSTLTHEANKLLGLAHEIAEIDVEKHKDLSWKRFQERRKCGLHVSR